MASFQTGVAPNLADGLNSVPGYAVANAPDAALQQQRPGAVAR